ncbi:hypothetical protein B0H19DRAFT_1062452 [Mycena capillaripes]|nr:hypothetical protein B0H19DRAFT_1062452 [Mycena capillaripes]
MRNISLALVALVVGVLPLFCRPLEAAVVAAHAVAARGIMYWASGGLGGGVGAADADAEAELWGQPFRSVADAAAAAAAGGTGGNILGLRTAGRVVPTFSSDEVRTPPDTSPAASFQPRLGRSAFVGAAGAKGVMKPRYTMAMRMHCGLLYIINDWDGM